MVRGVQWRVKCPAILTVTAVWGLSFCLATLAAEQKTGSILLRGEVRAITELQVVSDASAENLDLNNPGPQTVTVATVHELCNVAQGYTVVLASQNAAQSGDSLPHLLSTSGTGRVNYTVLWEDRAIQVGGDGQALVSDEARPTSASGTPRVLRVQFQGGGNAETGQALEPGFYTDTLTFQITAK